MQDPVGTVSIFLIVAIVFGPPVLSLVAMRRQGKGWARTRIIAYSLTCVVYAVNSTLLFGKGNGAGGGTSAIIAYLAGKGALAAWQAWRRCDYRPTHLRTAVAATDFDRPVDARSPR